MDAYKVIVVGSGGVGKTSIVRELLGAQFKTKYTPTIEVAVHTLDFETSKGPIRFNVWDCAGKEGLTGLKDGYYIKAQAVVFVFDLSDPQSFKDLATWSPDVEEMAPGIPRVFVGAKSDRLDIQEPLTSIEIVTTSAKTKENCRLPFLTLARKLKGDPSLQFV